MRTKARPVKNPPLKQSAPKERAEEAQLFRANVKIRVNHAKARDLKGKGLLPAEKKEELKLMDITLRSCARDGRVGAHVIEWLQAQADKVVRKPQQKPLWLRKILAEWDWEQSHTTFFASPPPMARAPRKWKLRAQQPSPTSISHPWKFDAPAVAAT